ncbi:MAG TPA: dihydropteroate synthase [bacterium]|nr:dihydropteroate synthase [bacterium]
MNVFPFEIRKEEYIFLMNKLKVSHTGTSIMKDRFSLKSFMITDISTPAANVIKQHVLALGGEAAVPAHSVNCSEPKSDLVFSIREDRLPQLLEKFRCQCWKLPEAAEIIQNIVSCTAPWFNFNSEKIKTDRPLVMGILNVTPDSFSDGGKFHDPEKALERALEMVHDGADIIDIGGESTRPGSMPVEAQEEIKRTVPVIKMMRENGIMVPVSIDTSKSEVAKAALDAGADIINDISGFTFDDKMSYLAGESGVPVILMHILGRPSTMQKNPEYKDIFPEMLDHLKRSVETAFAAGVKKENIILDPGIGFGKTLEHNIAIVKHLEVFHSFAMPVLAGVSRKSFIGSITGRKEPVERVAGSTALHLSLLQKGAAIIRAHDIKEAADTVRIYMALNREQTC